MADAARRAGVRDRRRRHQGRRARQGRRDVHHDGRHRPAAAGRVASTPRSVRPGDRVLLSGPSAITASRSCSRAATWISRRICRPTRGPCCRWSRRWSRRPGPACAGCATRPAAASRRRSTSWRATAVSACTSLEERVPVRDAVRGACELLGLDPLHIANEGQFLAVVAPELADAALAALARAPGGAERARSSARCATSPHGPCCRRLDYGGTRDRRHAGRRSTAAHLLRARWPTTYARLTARIERPAGGAQPALRGILRARSRPARGRLPGDVRPIPARADGCWRSGAAPTRLTRSTSRSSSSTR